MLGAVSAPGPKHGAGRREFLSHAPHGPGAPPHGKPPDFKSPGWRRGCLDPQPPADVRLSDAEAFSVYGILTGMALPFILFPSAITNSIAVLLLPSVAKDQAEGHTESISGSVAMALRYSLYMGILCIGIFVLFGLPLGISVFKEEEAGRCMQILAWLCPFLYLAATMGSILNGLAVPGTTFLAKRRRNAAAALLRGGCHSRFRDLRLPLWNAGQRNVPGHGAPVVLKTAGLPSSGMPGT